MILIISSSLNPNSLSRVMAQQVKIRLEENNAEAEFIDMRNYDLPFCDGDSCYNHPKVKEVKEKIQSARAILCASPVYNYDVNAVLKNLVELTGKAWENKTVGLVCSAGGQGSYMSPMPFLNSLMLDFRCHIIPRFVYTTKFAFTDGAISDENLKNRIKELSAEFKKYKKIMRWKKI